MSISSSNEPHTVDLQERKRRFRERLKNVSAREKIRQLEDLPERYYELLLVRVADGGPAISEGWQRWKRAQARLNKPANK